MPFPIPRRTLRSVRNDREYMREIDSQRKHITNDAQTGRPEYQVKFNVPVFTFYARNSFNSFFLLVLLLCLSYSFQDYHVFFMHNPAPTRCLIFDLDTTLPFPTYFHKYVTETFRSDLALRPEHHRYVPYFSMLPAGRWTINCDIGYFVKMAKFSTHRHPMNHPRKRPSVQLIQSHRILASRRSFVCMVIDYNCK